MAKLVFLSEKVANNLLKIFTTDYQLNNAIGLPSEDQKIIVEISDADAQNILRGKNWISFDESGNLSLAPMFSHEYDKEKLDALLEKIKIKVNRFLSIHDSNHDLYADVTSYKNYLDNLDTSTLTYPINSWAEYCYDNNITYVSEYQL